MTDFKIAFEWEDPLGARGPELQATWSRLQVLVDGRPVTRFFDERSKTVRDSVHVPLYPLAERLVTQWWPLWNEAIPPQPADRPGYEARHSLVGAREGYALPALRIEPTGAAVMLSWSQERLPAHRVEFIGSGKVWAETRLVKREISSLIDTVIGRLRDMGLADSLLQQEWEAIRSIDREEREFCECAGSLGLDPYSLDEKQKQEILQAADRLPEPMVNEFFRAARTRELMAEADEISTALRQAENNTTDLTSLKELRDLSEGLLAASGGMPWEQGYSFAQQLRRHLGLDGTPLESVENVARALGTTEEHILQVVTEFPSRETAFVGLMGINDRFSPAFVLRKALPASRLFHFCRALFEYLCSATQRSALITEAATEQQQRNRAFAAEWLAPSSALRARIKNPEVTWEQAEEIADEFGVSVYVIRNQLENHRIARVQDTQDT